MGPEKVPEVDGEDKNRIGFGKDARLWDGGCSPGRGGSKSHWGHAGGQVTGAEGGAGVRIRG